MSAIRSNKNSWKAVSGSPNPSDPVQFSLMNDRQFEEFCCSLMSKEKGIKSANIYKRKRQKQFGADIIAKREDSLELEIGSCKCYKGLRKGDIAKFSNEFLDHWQTHWKDKNVKRFVLCVAADVSAGEREAEVEVEENRFRELGVSFEVWSPRQLQEKLRPHYGVACQYLCSEELANRVCGRPQPQITQPGASEIINYTLIAELQNVLSEKTQLELEAAQEQVRQGKAKGIGENLERLKADSNRWIALTSKVRASILRFEGILALEQDKINDAIQLCNESKMLDSAEAIRLEALIVRHQRGAVEALKVLNHPATKEGLHLKAALLIESQNCQDALTVLKGIQPESLDAETYRLFAIAYLHLDSRDEALHSIQEAERLAPQWVSIVKVGAVVRYAGALSPALTTTMDFWPTPIDPAHFQESVESKRLLEEAQDSFSLLVAKAIDLENRHSALLWRMACIIAQKNQTREKIQTCFNEIIWEDRAHPGAIMWGLAFGLEFDYDLSISALKEKVASKNVEVSHVLALAAIEDQQGRPEKAIESLKANEKLFADPHSAQVLAYWIARIQSYKAKSTRDFDKNPSGTLHVAIKSFRATKKANYLAKLIREQKVNTLEEYAILSAFAEQGFWKQVDERREFLVKKIQTPEALRLAIFAAYYNNDLLGCNSLLHECVNIFSGETLPQEIKRIEIKVARRLGDSVYAQTEAFKLLAEEGDPADILEYLGISAQLGDLDAIVPQVQRMVRDRKLNGDQAIQLAPFVKGTKPILHRELVELALELGISKGYMPLMISEGIAADLGKRMGSLFATMHEMSGDNGEKLFTYGTLEDLKKLIEHQQERNQNAWKLFSEGKIPIHFLFGGSTVSMAQYYWKAFHENEDIRKIPPLFLHHGNRAVTDEIEIEFQDWRLHIDISSLFIAFAVGLLEKFDSAGVRFWIPSDTQLILFTMETELLPPQPDRIDIFKRILNLVSARKIGVRDQHESTLEEETYIRFDNSEKGSTTNYVNLRGFLDSLALVGVLDKTGHETVLESLGTFGRKEPVGHLIKGQRIVFDFNTIESFASQDLLGKICSLFRVSIESHYFEHLKNEMAKSETAIKVISWVGELRNTITKSMVAGNCRSLPRREKNVEANDKSPSELLIPIHELFCVEKEEHNFLWIDDRCINGFSNADGTPICSVLDVLSSMKKGGIIDESFYFLAIQKLRSASAVFLPLLPGEVLHHLGNAQIDGQEVIETPSLATIRASFSKSLILEDKINLLQRADDLSAMVHGEFNWLSQSIQLFGNVLQLIWQNETLEVAHKAAWSEWAWKSLRVEQLDCIPINDPSEGGRKGMFVMLMCGLITSAIGMHNDRKTRLEYLHWVATNILEPRFDFDPEFEKGFRSALKHQFLSLDEKNELDSEEFAYFRRHSLIVLAEDLPALLKGELLEDREFTTSLGISTNQLLSIQGFSFDAGKFWNAIQIALKSGRASILSKDKISKLTLDYINGPQERDYPQLVLSGCCNGQIGHPSMLLLVKGADPKSFSEQAIRKGWIDYAIFDAESKIEKILLLESHFQRTQDLELMMENSAPYFYSRLRNSISSGKETPLDYFVPSNNEMITRSLRIKPTSDAFEDLLSDAAHELIAQYGPVEAFDRLSFLPVRIPEFVTSGLLQANKNGTINLCEFLVSRPNGIISVFHRLKLLLEVRNELEIEDGIITSFIGAILEDWKAKANAFIEILSWSECLLASFEDASNFRKDLLLANIWTHAGNIFEIAFKDRQYSFAPRVGFFASKRNYIPETYFTIDATLGLFAECVEGLSQEYILLQGLNYGVAKDEDIHFLEDMHHSLLTSILVSNGAEITPLYVISAREKAAKRLGGVFSISALEIIKRFSLKFPLLADETTTTDEIAQFALSMTLEPNTSCYGWALLGHCGAKWLPVEQLRQAQENIKEFDILTALNENRGVCIRAVQELMSWPFRNGSQETQEAIERMIISCAKHFGQADLGSDCDNQETTMTSNLELLLQFVLWASKSPEIRDSLEIFCRTIRQIIYVWPESGMFWRNAVHQIMGGTRFEISEPLWKLFNELRCDVSS